MIVYIDTSALVKRYIREEHSEKVAELLATNKAVASVAITFVEFTSALVKAVRLQRIDRQDAEKVHEVFWDDWGRRIIWISVQDDVIVRASCLACRHELRAYDAVHLAAATWLRDTAEERILLASFDDQLRQAGRKEHLRVWPEQL